MRHVAGIALMTLLAACRGFMDPEGASNDRFVFESPTQAVLWVYRCLDDGRYDDMTLPMFQHADKSPWIARAESGERHPWTESDEAAVRVNRLVEISASTIEIGVEETWAGGQTERNFVCRETPDGWRIVSIEGAPGDGMLRR